MKTLFCETPRGRLAYSDSGVVSGQESGPPLILMHGLPTAKEIWDPVRPLLDAGRRVVAFDLHDYGESDRLDGMRAGPIGHAERAAMLDRLRAHLGFDRFVLVAHDLGASVAIDYLGAFGAHVERLVLMSPPVWPDFREPAVVKLVRLPGLGEALLWVMSEYMLDRSIRQGMVHRERYTAAIAGAIHRAYAGAAGRAALMRCLRWGRPAEMFAGYPAIMRSIAAPTLVVQGARDPYIPREHAERVVADVPDGRLVVIEEGGHFLPMDAPEAVAAAINGFL